MTLEKIIAAHTLLRTSISDPLRCGCGLKQEVSLGRSVIEPWAAHVAAEIRKAHTVTTVEQLDALPADTIIRDDEGDAFQKDLVSWWEAGVEVRTWSEDVPLPARVVWLPTDETGV